MNLQLRRKKNSISFNNGSQLDDKPLFILSFGCQLAIKSDDSYSYPKRLSIKRI